MKMHAVRGMEVQIATGLMTTRMHPAIVAVGAQLIEIGPSRQRGLGILVARRRKNNLDDPAFVIQIRGKRPRDGLKGRIGVDRHRTTIIRRVTIRNGYLEPMTCILRGPQIFHVSLKGQM